MESLSLKLNRLKSGIDKEVFLDVKKVFNFILGFGSYQFYSWEVLESFEKYEAGLSKKYASEKLENALYVLEHNKIIKRTNSGAYKVISDRR